MNDDPELLRRYVDENSQEAFAELVQRHLSLVYHAALRQTGGDAHRAEDVAQLVFTDLARKARTLMQRPDLAGWLYTSVRYSAAQAVRTERRRQEREQKVYLMNELLSDAEPAADWERLRPVIDEALHDLGERDREAVLLRFFEGGSFAAIGAKFATSEDAARMRVDRALEKMRGLLARRGVVSTTAALGLALGSQAGAAVPAGLATTVAGAALAGATAAGGAAVIGGILTIMSTTKIIGGTAAVMVLLAVGSAIYQTREARRDAAALVSANRQQDDLRAQLSSVQKRAQEAEQAVGAVQKELADLRAKPTPAAPPPATSTVGAQMEHVLDHPELHAAFLEQQMLRVRARYDRFFRTAGLSAAQENAVLKAMEEGAGAELDWMAALHARGYGVGNLPKDPQERAALTSLRKEKAAASETALRAALGDDGYARLAQYAATIPERNVADQVASQLYYTDAPLTAAQAEQLAQVLRENKYRQGEPSPHNTMGRTFVVPPESVSNRIAQAMQQGGMTLYDWQTPITDAAMERAQAILMPPQFAALQRLQAQQVTELQLAPPSPRRMAVPAASASSGGK